MVVRIRHYNYWPFQIPALPLIIYDSINILNSNPQLILIWCVYIKSGGFTFGIKEKTILECLNELSALFPVQHPNVTLGTMLTACVTGWCKFSRMVELLPYIFSRNFRNSRA